MVTVTTGFCVVGAGLQHALQKATQGGPCNTPSPAATFAPHLLHLLSYLFFSIVPSTIVIIESAPEKATPKNELLHFQ
jgi:cytochrome b561